MNINTAEVLHRGMSCLLEKMNVIEAEQFIFLVKAENFDYTQWQRDYFDNKSQSELEHEMDIYFAAHPYTGDPSKII